MTLELTPNGTYGATMPMPPKPLRGLLFGIGNFFIKLRGGRILNLTTVGSKSGNQHHVPLGWFPAGPDAWVVVGSAAGAAKHPAWFFNMVRNPDKIWIEVDGRRVHVQGETLKGEAYDQAWKQVIADSPNYAAYPKSTDRIIPLVRLTPTA